MKHKLGESTSKNSIRTRKVETPFDKDGINDREYGSKGKLQKKVKFKGMQSGEEGSGGEFGERGKLKTLDSYGKKKRIYVKEGTVEKGKLRSRVGASNMKTLFEKGEKLVKDELVVKKTGHRSMWVSNKSMDAGSEAKNSSSRTKEKKVNIILATDKHKAKAKKVGTRESVTTDDHRSGLLKKTRTQESASSKGKGQKVVSPSNSPEKKARSIWVG